MISPRQVILIPDDTVRPPKPKLVVCIEPELGWFYRINSKRWPPALPLAREPHHLFLDHDSYLECGDPLEIDDYIVSEALRRHGVLGEVHESLTPNIIALLVAATTLRDDDRKRIIDALS